MLRVLILILLLNGCSISRGCYVGVSLFPPGPFIHCGIDTSDDEEDDDDV